MATKKEAKKIQTASKQANSKKMNPTKKAAKKKQTTSKQVNSKKMNPAKKTAKKLAIKGGIPKKRSANKRGHKEVTAQANGKSRSARRRLIDDSSEAEETLALSPRGPAEGSGGQSGDLQGLSSVEGADSESVVELLEEGNAFEAAIVAGVENAGNTNPREVRTHEVLEDDVPDEYLDRE
jgi:hypothetical protein